MLKSQKEYRRLIKHLIQLKKIIDKNEKARYRYFLKLSQEAKDANKSK